MIQDEVDLAILSAATLYCFARAEGTGDPQDLGFTEILGEEGPVKGDWAKDEEDAQALVALLAMSGARLAQVKILRKDTDPICTRISTGGNAALGYYVVYRGLIKECRSGS